jgi:hypothetical protein
VDRLHATHLKFVHDKAVLRARIEAQLRNELDALEYARAEAARVCQALGVPKSKMLEAIGTTSYSTIYEILGRGGATPVNNSDSAVLRAVTNEGGQWYATSPDGCKMRLNEHGRGYALDMQPGPVGREWDETPILPTPAWEAWYEANADLIAEHVRAS